MSTTEELVKDRSGAPADSGRPSVEAWSDDPWSEDPHGKDKAGRAAMKDLMKPVAPVLVVARILAGISGVLAIFPYISLVWLGDILLSAWTAGVAPDNAEVSRALLILIGTFTGRVGVFFLALGLTHFADMRLSAILRERIVEALARVPLAWYTTATSGRIRKVVQDDTKTLHTLVAHQPVETTAAIVMPVALFVYALVIDWRLGLLAILTFPIYLALQALTLKDMAPKTALMDTKLARVSATMVEFVSGITVVKAFGVVGHGHKNYSDAAREFSDFYLDWVRPLMKGSAVAMSVVSPPVLLFVNLAGGAAMVNAGWVTAPEVLTTTLIALILPASVITIGNSSWAYQLAGASALRITQVLGTRALPEAADPHTPTEYTVDFDHVSFSYGDTRAADDVTFILPQGSVTALIGPSGSGKSTLAMLLARFADPDAGSVRIGGVDVRDIASSELYRTVSFVLQNPQLLHMSIRDNIALAKPDATDAEVREAAAHAQIDSFISSLPDGYQTVVGGSVALSGGQAQRIAIARAILSDTPILLLDEATAFTDPESEAEIQHALNRLVRGRTVLVIAHRPASVIGADHIVVLDRGCVIAKGTHEALRDEPHYAALWKATSGRTDDQASAEADPRFSPAQENGVTR